jgi:hypothetical protein
VLAVRSGTSTIAQGLSLFQMRSLQWYLMIKLQTRFEDT